MARLRWIRKKWGSKRVRQDVWDRKVHKDKDVITQFKKNIAGGREGITLVSGQDAAAASSGESTDYSALSDAETERVAVGGQRAAMTSRATNAPTVSAASSTRPECSVPYVYYVRAVDSEDPLRITAQGFCHDATCLTCFSNPLLFMHYPTVNSPLHSLMLCLLGPMGDAILPNQSQEYTQAMEQWLRSLRTHCQLPSRADIAPTSSSGETSERPRIPSYTMKHNPRPQSAPPFSPLVAPLYHLLQNCPSTCVALAFCPPFLGMLCNMLMFETLDGVAIKQLLELLILICSYAQDIFVEVMTVPALEYNTPASQEGVDNGNGTHSAEGLSAQLSMDMSSASHPLSGLDVIEERHNLSLVVKILMEQQKDKIMVQTLGRSLLELIEGKD